MAIKDWTKHEDRQTLPYWENEDKELIINLSSFPSETKTGRYAQDWFVEVSKTDYLEDTIIESEFDSKREALVFIKSYMRS